MDIDQSYDALCEAQRTPYLQWLREQEPVHMDGKGKRPKLLPFLSCEESLVQCLERSGESMTKQDELWAPAAIWILFMRMKIT